MSIEPDAGDLLGGAASEGCHLCGKISARRLESQVGQSRVWLKRDPGTRMERRIWNAVFAESGTHC